MRATPGRKTASTQRREKVGLEMQQTTPAVLEHRRQVPVPERRFQPYQNSNFSPSVSHRVASQSQTCWKEQMKKESKGRHLIGVRFPSFDATSHCFGGGKMVHRNSIFSTQSAQKQYQDSDGTKSSSFVRSQENSGTSKPDPLILRSSDLPTNHSNDRECRRQNRIKYEEHFTRKDSLACSIAIAKQKQKQWQQQ